MNATTSFIYSNIDKINQSISEDYSHFISAQLVNKSPENSSIEVNNKSTYPIYIDSILIDGDEYSIAQYLSRKSTKIININKVHLYQDDVLLKYRFGGRLDDSYKKILKWTDNEISKIYEPKVINEILKREQNYILGEVKKKWVFDRNIVLSPKNSLIVLPGVTIDLIKGASLTVLGGGVEFNGEEDNKIKIISSDGTGQGLIVLNSLNKSYITHTEFIGLNNFNNDQKSQTAPVVFYESDVEISNSTFTKNKSEDALNIIRSSFVLNKVLFKENPSDAFDSDFSSGKITNSNFTNIGNDAIDLSGSEVSINSVAIESALDKGISIGEKSNITGKNIIIKKSGVAISAKDSSSFLFDNVELSHNDVAVALFNKKEEFSGAAGILNNATLLGNGVDYLVEKDSEMYIDDTFMKGEVKNVKELMYGQKYGAKTGI